MFLSKRFGKGLAVFLGGAMSVFAQNGSLPAPAPAPVGSEQPLYLTNVNDISMGAASGLQSHSLPGELAEDIASPASPASFGATPVDQVRFLMDNLGLKHIFGDSGIRAFGWLEAGYTGSTSGSGLQSVQPRQNRYGNEFLLNQMGLVIQKPLQQDRFDIGFNIRYFAGADAALGQPAGGIDSPPGNSRFSQDFRDLYISAHLPILTEKGMDIKVGRMNTIIGYNGFLAPYRPFYSSDYQFFYSQDGAFTGFLTNLHVSDQLDIWNGMTLGANTFFEKRSSNSICYIGQIDYWLTTEKRTRLTASLQCGPDAIFAAPGMNGDFATIVELRLQQNWTECFTQVIQTNMGWDTNTPVGTGAWYGLYTVGILHLNANWDTQGRLEWFNDANGTRTGIDAQYSAVTFGLNWHPNQYLEVRPEIRGDFADRPAFGGGGNPNDKAQLTGVMSALIKF